MEFDLELWDRGSRVGNLLLESVVRLPVAGSLREIDGMEAVECEIGMYPEGVCFL